MPKKKAKYEESFARTLRKSVLKIAAAAGAAGMALSMLTVIDASRFQATAESHYPFANEFTAPLSMDDHPPNLQSTEFFDLGAGEMDGLDHQHWIQFTPFHSDSSPTYIWAFNGQYPAPACLQRYLNSTMLKDSLQTSTTTVDTNEITIRWYNGYYGSESDGFANDFFQTAFSEENLYHDIYTPPDAFSWIKNPEEKVGSFWYHSHRADLMLNPNAMNGMFVVFGYANSSEDSLPLPGYYSITDFPLILTDKKFCLTDGRTNNNVAGSFAWTHPIHVHFEEFQNLKGFVNGVEISLPPLWSGGKNVSFAEGGQKSLNEMHFMENNGTYRLSAAGDGVMDRRGIASTEQRQASSGGEPYAKADLCFYSIDCAMSSPITPATQTGSGGQFYGQNPV